MYRNNSVSLNDSSKYFSLLRYKDVKLLVNLQKKEAHIHVSLLKNLKYWSLQQSEIATESLDFNGAVILGLEELNLEYVAKSSKMWKTKLSHKPGHFF